MSVLERLGLKPIVNAAHFLTMYGGSVLSPSVVHAMAEAAVCYVDMEDLHDRVGQTIAEATGSEAGFVTSGCAEAMFVATAACALRGHMEKRLQLPDVTGLKSEVIIQKAQRNAYDYMFRLPGTRLREIGERDGTELSDLEGALSDQTAAVAYVGAEWLPGRGGLTLSEVTATAHRRDVPVIVDGANALPPASNLRRLTAEGGDLVCFSGGKAIRGPNNTGILCGRRDLVHACRALTNLDASKGIFIGRPGKVGKEGIVGVAVALQEYLTTDHDAEMRSWEARAKRVAEQLSGIANVNAEAVLPGPSGTPWVRIMLDEGKLGRTKASIIADLKEGEPSIRVGGANWPGPIGIHLFTLRESEDEAVVRRVKEALSC